jgi:Beta-eliminating lyase
MGRTPARGRVLRGLVKLRAVPRRHAGRARLSLRRPRAPGARRGKRLLRRGDRPGGDRPFERAFRYDPGAHRDAPGVALDLPVPEALDPDVEAPFKGEMDVDALGQLLDGPDGERISIVMLTITNNTGGGQPVSLANVREVAALAHSHGKKLVMDIARFAESAWFIREREQGWAGRPLGEIVHELLAEADAILMSAKKDAIANIGGFVAIRDDETFFRRLQAPRHRVRGLPDLWRPRRPRPRGDRRRPPRGARRGLLELSDRAGRLPGALARRGGCRRGAAVRGPRGLPRRGPDASAHLGGALPSPSACLRALPAAGVRGVEIGSVMAGRDPLTGENRHPTLELVRLAVPRRVYTSRQLEQAADAVAEIVADPDAFLASSSWPRAWSCATSRPGSSR